MKGPTNHSVRNGGKKLPSSSPLLLSLHPSTLKAKPQHIMGPWVLFNGWVCSDAKVIGS